MEKKQMYAAVAAVVVIIVVVAAAVWYMSGNDGGEDSEPGDTYYIYLDGMGDIDGWYTGTGNDARDATVNALEAEGITVDTSGWAIRINDFIQDSSMGYGISSRTRPWVTESMDTAAQQLKIHMQDTSSTALSLRM